MMNQFRTLCCRAALVCTMAVFLPFQSFAASGRISFSDPSAKAGSEVSVTMKFASTDGVPLGNTDVMLAYDAELLEYINETENASGGAGAIRVWTPPEGKTEMVTTLRFRTLKPGTAKITITDWEGYDDAGASLTEVKQGSSAISIEALKTSSDDAKLLSLQVSPGTLEPSFNSDVESYEVTVGLDVEKLTVSANPNNEKANVSIEGASELAEGTNTVVCKVTAEDGSTVKNYTITVNKTEGGATDNPPTENGEAGEPAQELEVLAELDVTAKKIRITSLPDGIEVPSYLKESSIAIGDVKVQGWTSAREEKPSYCVFYGMNENDEVGFYRYDLRDKTVQRFFQNEAGGAVSQQDYELVVAEHDKLVDDYNHMMFLAIGLGVVSLILVIALVAVLRSRKGTEEEIFMEKAEKREPKTSHSSHSKKLSKEERYMMGEEEEYEAEETNPDDYMPELAEAAMTKEPEKELSSDESEEDDFEFFDL